jgi:quercetin dioxygenase-like cupin family protein
MKNNQESQIDVQNVIKWELLKQSKMKDNLGLEKGKAHIIIEIIEYVPNAVVSRTIIKKTTGNVTATSMSIGEELGERISPFDTYVQIIDGAAEVKIDDKSVFIKLGEGIVIPAHAKQSFTANEQFKMITTVIKSGYDE